MHFSNNLLQIFRGLFTVVSLLSIVSCRRGSGEIATAPIFETWFSGTTQPPSALVNTPVRALDSLGTVIRSQTRAGNGSVLLTDTMGVTYTAGYGTPAAYRADSTYPCIIYLHGGTGSQRSDKGEHAWEMLQMLADSMDLFFASPSANRQAPWWSPAGLSRILQTIRYMTLHYPVNPDKVFLAGVSDGATGCWAAANTIAAPFAGFIAISGYGGMLPQLGMKLYPENLMQRNIYNVNAGRDRLYPLETVNSFLDWMEQQGVGVLRKTYPDEEHGFDYPFSIDGVVSVEGNGSSSFSFRKFSRNDTIFLQTAGLGRLRMYFETDRSGGAEKYISINNGKPRRFKRQVPDNSTVLQYMKQRCFPIITDGVVVTIPL
jgi:pimeloyl-ACP methyl ester carboxylesterase